MSNRKKHLEVDDNMRLCDCCASWVFDTVSFKEAVSEEASLKNPVNNEDLTGREVTLCEECNGDLEEDLETGIDSDVQPPEFFQKIWNWVKLEAVLNFIGPEDRPHCVDDVAEFFEALSGLMLWHPEDSFDQYVYGRETQAGKEHQEDRRIFTDGQAIVLNCIMKRCFGICEENGKDIFEVAMEASRKVGQLPLLPEYPQPKKYTVILMYPDYATEQYGETWCDTVEGQNVDEAIKRAQAECAKGCQVERPEDIMPISIFEGEHTDKINEWSEIR